MTGIILSALKGNNPFKKCKKKPTYNFRVKSKKYKWSINYLNIFSKCLLMFL